MSKTFQWPAIVLSLFLAMGLGAQTIDYAMTSQGDSAVYYICTGAAPYAIPFSVTRNTQDTASVLKYSYSVNNGAIQKSQVSLKYKGDNCVYPPTLAIYRIACTVPISMNVAGDFYIKIWIDSINGNQDLDVSNDTMVRHYRALENLQNRGGLLEYFYHMTCEPCGEFGTPYIENILGNYSDKVSVVKIHNSYGQPSPYNLYDCADGAYLDSALFYTSGHPNCTFNRNSLNPFANPTNHSIEFYPHVDQCPTDSAFIIRDNNFYNKVPSNLAIEDLNIDTLTNIVSFKSTALFLADINFTTSTRLSCMLVEDSLFNYQANGNAPGPDSVFHRFVLRKIYGGPLGLPGSVPSSVSAAQKVTMQVVDTLDAKFRKQNLFLIPILQSWAGTLPLGAEILNAQRVRMMSLYYPSGLRENQPDLTLDCFPNPAKTITTIRTSEELKGGSYVLTSVDGTTIRKAQGLTGQNIILDLKDLPSGLYFVVVNCGTRSHRVKIIKQ
jgi:hypothetical protein